MGFRDVYNWATEPLVPKSLVDQVDAPALDRSPAEGALRGFGAGALESLRGMTSPLGLAATALGPAAGRMAGGAMKALPGAIRGLRGATPVAEAGIQLLEEAPGVKQVMPGMGDVDEIIAGLKGNLENIPSKGFKPTPPQNPMTAPRPNGPWDLNSTPPGGMRPVNLNEEELYNQARNKFGMGLENPALRGK